MKQLILFYLDYQKPTKQKKNAWNAYLLAAKGQEHSVWCLGKTQLILFTTDQVFPPENVFIPFILNQAGLPLDSKGFNITYNGQELAWSRPFSHTQGHMSRQIYVQQDFGYSKKQDRRGFLSNDMPPAVDVHFWGCTQQKPSPTASRGWLKGWGWFAGFQCSDETTNSAAVWPN